MVKIPRRGLVGAALLALLASLAWVRSWRPVVYGTLAPPALPADFQAEWPRIDLARVEHPPEAPSAPTVDIFSGRTLQPAAARHESQPHPLPPPTTVPAAEISPVPAVALLPPLSLKFVGTVNVGPGETGIRVAVLLTDHKEILTGQTGELVANRFRIVRIGHESVDIQDLGSDNVRRIPLRGN